MDKKIIDDELLQQISGGQLKMSMVELAKLFIPSLKEEGYDKFDMMRKIDEIWNENNTIFSTDGSKEDYNELMRIILNDYDAY